MRSTTCEEHADTSIYVISSGGTARMSVSQLWVEIEAALSYTRVVSQTQVCHTVCETEFHQGNR